MASARARMPFSIRSSDGRLPSMGMLRIDTCSRVWAIVAASDTKSSQYPSMSELAAEAGN
jgi:hypothetical protein